MFGNLLTSKELRAAQAELAPFSAWLEAHAQDQAPVANMLLARTLAALRQDKRATRVALRDWGWSPRDLVVWTAARQAGALLRQPDWHASHPDAIGALHRLFDACCADLLRSGFLTRSDVGEVRGSLGNRAALRASPATAAA
ncbi:hypothetical protein [uncultured Caulobacter sp.]|uniref:hypothetical protein n=1 Tax=uncultured Caulobacter sp. TaxID=158749 RepID=UPI00260AC468|nr:hypothetical protein [uncultured Caulobacter sp.]